mgnify:CR=1 FL=1
MPNVNISDFPAQLDQILRSLEITRSSKNYPILCECVALICEQENRLEAVQKEIYTPISDQRRCKRSAIQSAVRRAAEKAWALNPEGVQQLAGVPVETLAAYAEKLLPDTGGIGRYPVRSGRPTGWVHVDVRAAKSRWKG